MALTRVYYDSANWTVTGNGARTTVATMAWIAADDVYVVGLVADNAPVFATPTNANLTFSLVTSLVAGTSEASLYLWKATAVGTNTSQTISATLSSAPGGEAAGICAWVVTGGGTAVAATNRNEAANSLTVTSGSLVINAWTDWNGVSAGWNGTTGSGTLTERADVHVAAQYTVWVGDWFNTAAGTFSFGTTAYTGMKITQLTIAIPDGAAAPVTIRDRVVGSKAAVHRASRW